MGVQVVKEEFTKELGFEVGYVGGEPGMEGGKPRQRETCKQTRRPLCLVTEAG